MSATPVGAGAAERLAGAAALRAGARKIVPLARQAVLYARTARHLRASQWLYWPLRRLQAGLPAGRPRSPRVALDDRIAARLAEAVLACGPGAGDDRLRRADAILSGSFCFLNQCSTLQEVDWSQRHVSHLWSYNLHYFDYALDLAWAYRLTGEQRFPRHLQHLVESWIAAHPTRRGDGWEPYPTSLRIVNWIYALLILGDAVSQSFRQRMASSIAAQAAFLRRRLEKHLLANHLQKNLKALALAGMFFRGPVASEWKRLGVSGLWRELFEQVLPDGGHFERSPMYHAVALADYLEIVDCLRRLGTEPPAEVLSRVRAMVRAFGILCRPDGTLHLFNDAAHGIAPRLVELSRSAERVVGERVPRWAGLLELAESGYFGWVDPSQNERFLIDCGEPGPAYQPGHAHCDLLSFELDLGGRPVVVDSGTCGYGGDPLREYLRSTRAHNTVMIGGREQSETWGTFRVGRRAAVVGAEQRSSGDGYRFTGAYRPYHDRRCAHVRTVERVAGRWRVVDRVEGADAAPLAGFIHLDPAIALERAGERVVASLGEQKLAIEMFGHDRFVLHRGRRDPAQGWVCPEFGISRPGWVIELRVERNGGEPFGFTIVPADA